MKTKTIGEILQAEREAHHLSISEMAYQTKIRPEYLESLEKNDFASLPAATFVKGYIRTYANLFGFDSEPLLALLRRDYKESAVGTLVPREFIKPLLKKRQIWKPLNFALVGLAVVFVTLVTYVGVQWYNIQKPPVLTVTEPKENDFVSSQITVKGSTSPEVIVSVNAQPVALQPTGQFETEIYLPRQGIHTITIEAVDRRGKKNVVQRSVHVRF